MQKSGKFWLLVGLILSLGLGQAGAVLADVPFNCRCQEEDRVLQLTDPFTSGADVSELQSSLANLGFYDAEPNATYDQATAEAVREFQEFAQLPATGVFGQEEQAALTLTLAGTSLAPSSLTPPAGELRLEINVETKTLTVLVDDVVFKVFPCAVGTSETKSPVGEWRVVQKGTHWGGGFGTRWMGLNVPWGIYGIHGTNKPGSIGSAASHGCIRMFNYDVEQLYPWVSIGTRVSIIGPFPKVKITEQLTAGRSGKDVQTLQLALREAGFSPGSTDGRFGSDTAAAINRLQQHYGLRQTGNADWNVLSLLGLR